MSFRPIPQRVATPVPLHPVCRITLVLFLWQDAPIKFERLVRQKRFVGAVGLLNESLLNIFSPELVDVPAVASVRDEMLVQKGRILDTLVEEIADVLFLRATTSRLNTVDQARGVALSRTRRHRGGTGGTQSEDSSFHALSRGQTTIGVGGVGFATDAASESSAGGGDGAGTMWAGIQVDVTDVGDDEEQALDDPSQDFSVYLRLLVEAVRRLRCLDDVERYLLERLSNEVITLSATHMRTCGGRHEEDGVKSRGVAVSGTGKNEGVGSHVQHLTQYLSLVFDSFTCVLANLMHLVRLLHAARLRDIRESDPGATVFEADAPYKESLVLGLWQHIQAHLKVVLTRHVAASRRDALATEVGKPDSGVLQSARGASGSSGTEALGVSSSVPYFRPVKGPESSSTGLVGTTMEVDHASAADFCRSCLLADPSPLIIINIFRPTLKFVDVEQVT